MRKTEKRGGIEKKKMQKYLKKKKNVLKKITNNFKIIMT